MAIAKKVASYSGSYSRSRPYSSVSSTAPIEKRYQVMGFWPRYEVMVMWKEETRAVIWGRKALRAWEVSMRMEGYKKWKKG